MNNELPAGSGNISMEHLITLAIEHWRLSRWLEGLSLGNALAQPRHALGRMAEALRKSELEALSLDGRPFDPGLAVRVVDVVDDADLPEGETTILETVSPQVLWRGDVIKAADVVTLRGTKR